MHGGNWGKMPGGINNVGKWDANSALRANYPRANAR